MVKEKFQDFFDEFYDFGHIVAIILAAIIGVAILCQICYSIVYEACTTEVNTYVTECEIAKITSIPERGMYMYVKNEDFVTAFPISQTDFALRQEGEKVRVKVKVSEHWDGKLEYEYQWLKNDCKYSYE